MTEQQKDIYRQLCRFCAYQERAESEVIDKLNKWEIDEKYFSLYINALKKDKFLNQKRFARFYAQGKFLNNKWGKIKIKQNLIQKKIDYATIHYAVDLISEKDYHQCIHQLIHKKAKQLKSKKQNLFVFRKNIVDFLRGKGYEVEIAWQLVKENFPDK